MYKLFIALRYLRANKIIYFSIAGVAIGIMVMIIVTSVMGGFSRDIQARIRGLQSHLVVKPLYANMYIREYAEIVEDIRRLPHVAGAAPRIEYAAWLSTAHSSPRNVFVVGIDPALEASTSELARFFARGGKKQLDFRVEEGGEASPPGVVVGSEAGLLSKLPVFLQSVRMGNQPMYMRSEFVVAGSFKSGMAEYDSEYAFVHLRDMQAFMKLGPPHQSVPVVNRISIAVDDYGASGGEVRRRVAETLHARKPCMAPKQHEFGQCGSFRVSTWEEERSVLLQAVAIERGIQVIILFCIIIVAGFNIIAIYTMMVRAKTRDVGILRSLGATRGGVVLIFLMSGGLCGLFGSLFGILAGTLLSTHLNEVVGFVRITSRELVRASWRDPQTVDWSTVSIAAIYFGGALIALIGSWIFLYGPLREKARVLAGASKRVVRFSWILAACAAVLLALASMAFFGWVGPYKPFDDDPSLSPHLTMMVAAVVAGLVLGWNGIRWLTDPWREFFLGSFVRVVGTLIYSALAIYGVAGLSITLGLLAVRPPWYFPGWDLFPRQIYYLDRVPVLIDPSTVVLIVAATLGVSLVFSVYPAIRAASYHPIEAIRDE